MTTSTFDEIVTLLNKYEGTKYTLVHNSLTILPEEAGFPVRMDIEPDSYIVSFLGWHEPFAIEEEALNCLALGLSEDCRLEVEFRGDTQVSWTVQYIREGDWASGTTIGLIYRAFWRKRSIGHLRNHLIKSITSYDVSLQR